MSKPYDSAGDTISHIERVRDLLAEVCARLVVRAQVHDSSKLHDPEKAIFDEYTPKLKETTYGSDEYKRFLAEMQPALEHHYAHNSHHPEHFPDGIKGMSLLDLIEMLCDWKAATERHADGSLGLSLVHNQDRFQFGEQLMVVLENTARELGWIEATK